MITISEINAVENFGIIELIQHVIKPRDMILVLDSNVVDGPIVHTHSLTTYFFSTKRAGTEHGFMLSNI